MSDDRLFASNNAIGRKWYALNLLILSVIAGGTHYLFNEHIIPHVTTDVYELIAKGFLYFAYLIYTVTFFALIERRLYDVTGTRDSKGYRNTSSILTLSIFAVGLELFCKWKNFSTPIPEEIITLSAHVLGVIFVLIMIILLFMKGSISNLSYEQYRRKIKYE
ncbi:MAG: hypothetical protein IJY61_01915 [Candidatus Gastranaerophilales bacterium]|nr:hypothetical protein [Candidatus Gastranaerophilales bacterium]